LVNLSEFEQTEIIRNLSLFISRGYVSELVFNVLFIYSVLLLSDRPWRKKP